MRMSHCRDSSIAVLFINGALNVLPENSRTGSYVKTFIVSHYVPTLNILGCRIFCVKSSGTEAPPYYLPGLVFTPESNSGFR